MFKVTVQYYQPAIDELRQELAKLVEQSNDVVLVGIHEGAGMADGDDLTMAQLGAIQHFGADINHPGGTSYGYKTKKDQDSGKVSFLKKGQGVFEMGITGPHKIKIPPRPFLDVGVMSGRDDYVRIMKEYPDDPRRCLELIGMTAAAKVQQYMTNLQSPPNAPSTIKKKGSSNPLINNGALRQSITYSITNEKPSEGL